MERKERMRLVVGAVESLPDAQREAFLLHEEGGLTIDEIAIDVSRPRNGQEPSALCHGATARPTD